ncbi:MAG: ribosome biogenesis GTP-binding protein YihA/YsxC [Eubacteriales bacterium]|nr:ribosome biogenesis GTP-binding protein YihA/YsxC [Eubacteriales bacterium]
MEKINFRRAKLAVAAHTKAQIPEALRPRIIFAGRSNVGKSSLINLLTGQKNLARVSQTPGKTQSLLFFDIDEKIWLVDLPGYGYAKSSYSKKEAFSDLVSRFLELHSDLSLVLLIIDSRRGLQKDEGDFLAWANAHNIPLRIVCNKIDQLKQSELQKLKSQFGKQALYTSVPKRRGLNELRQAIADAVGLEVLPVD